MTLFPYGRQEAMFARRHVGVCLLAAVSLLCSAEALPFLIKAVPVQISTTTDDRIFTVMRDKMLFLPPDRLLYVVKQSWRESSSFATTFVSLQIYNSDTAIDMITNVNPMRFITRDGGTQPKDFTPRSVFQVFANETRLFQVQKCGFNQRPAPVTFFSEQAGSVLNILSTQLDDASQLLRLSVISINEDISCSLSNQKIHEYPSVVQAYGSPHPSPLPSRGRRSIESTTTRVQLLVDFGNELFVVGVLKARHLDTYELRILPYRAKSCTIATAFNYKGFDEYHVRDEDGTLVRRPAFTLQHAATRMYITSDVLDNLALNTSGASVTLKNDTELDTEPSGFPDYRYFSRYDDEALNFRTCNEALTRNTSYYNRTVHIFCAVHHRRYCLKPVKSGPLQMVAVSPEYELPFPTLADPSEKFLDFLESLNGSSIIPTFRFLRM